MISEAQLKQWTEQARRDDWHMTFVGSDIRQMLGDIGRLRTALANLVAHDTNDPDRNHNGSVYCWMPKQAFKEGRDALVAEQETR